MKDGGGGCNGGMIEREGRKVGAREYSHRKRKKNVTVLVVSKVKKRGEGAGVVMYGTGGRERLVIWISWRLTSLVHTLILPPRCFLR